MKLFDKASEGPVLVLCPHTDDEFGCAGTIAKLLSMGAVVHYFALSRCEESVPAGYPLETLEVECRAATMALGIDPERVVVGRFQVRKFPSQRQQILETLVEIRKRIAPSLVLLPSRDDCHQDHQTVATEGFRAFKHSTVLGYELPQNLTVFRSDVYVGLSGTHLEQKCLAMAEYKSQSFRPYASSAFIRSLASVRGVQIGIQYAEAFEVLRVVC